MRISAVRYLCTALVSGGLLWAGLDATLAHRATVPATVLWTAGALAACGPVRLLAAGRLMVAHGRAGAFTAVALAGLLMFMSVHLIAMQAAGALVLVACTGWVLVRHRHQLPISIAPLAQDTVLYATAAGVAFSAGVVSALGAGVVLAAGGGGWTAMLVGALGAALAPRVHDAFVGWALNDVPAPAR